MQVLACNSPLDSHIIISHRRQLRRRELFFDGISSVFSHTETHNHSSNHVLPSQPISIPRTVRDQTKDLGEVIRRNIPFTTRRMLFASLFMYSWYHPSSPCFRGSSCDG